MLNNDDSQNTFVIALADPGKIYNLVMWWGFDKNTFSKNEKKKSSGIGRDKKVMDSLCLTTREKLSAKFDLEFHLTYWLLREGDEPPLSHV